MPNQQATIQNAQDLGPQQLRNEIVDKADQMNRIQVDGTEYASAMTEFPLINLDDPDDAWYSVDSARGPMDPVGLSSESPIGTLDLPSKEQVEIASYKKKYQPEKGVETHLQNNSPFSLFTLAADYLRLETFLTREQITWRGDGAVDGLIGERGNSSHPDVDAIAPAALWSDEAGAQIFNDVSAASWSVQDNGTFTGQQGRPYVYASPGTIRDARKSDDLENRVSGVQVQSLNTGDVESILEEEVLAFRKVNVQLPRTNAAGEFIDENGAVVEDVTQAAMDNVLEPWDPDANAGAGGNRRNVVVGIPGAGSAYIPWFLDRLTEQASQAPDPGQVSIDTQNGFFTQVWNEPDPIGPNFKAAQEIGFDPITPENWVVIQDV